MRRLIFIYLLPFLTLTVGAQNEKYDYFMLEAERLSAQGDYAAAYDIYRYCLDVCPESGAARYMLSSINRYLREDSLSIRLMEEASRLYPDNYWYKDMLVKLYFTANRKQEAQTVLEDMANTFPDKSDVLMMLIDLYGANSDYENMIKALDKLEVKEGKSEQLSMEKFRIYVQMKDEKSAFREMRELADEYPNDLKYQVLIGDLYLDRGTDEGRAKALEQYRMVEAKDPDNINMMISMSNYYQTIGNDSLCQNYILRMVTNPKLDRQIQLQLVGSMVYENLRSDAANDSVKMLAMFDRVLAMPQEDIAMHELCARYMVSSGISKERMKPVLRQMLEIEPESDIARNQLLAYAIEETDTASIYSLCKPAVEYGADNPVYYFYLGIVYYQQENHDNALETFRKGLEHVNQSSSIELVSKLHSLIGDLYHEKGDAQKAYMEYDSCLIYRYDDAYVLNNYAYYLSLEKKDLDRAEKMSRRSNELDADNPTYLDTYAWVLYQQKRYDEAKEKIDKALELMGDSIDESDATVLEHAGDIYFRCGDVLTALDYWMRVKTLGGGDNPKALERKIKRRKL